MIINFTNLPTTVEIPDWWIYGIGGMGIFIIGYSLYRIFNPRGHYEQ
jgi:hypothetical protein